RKIPHTINSMAPTIGGESWPPLLEEKMLDVFIAAQEKAEQNGLGSKHASYWDDAVSEVNGHIQDNFPYLLPKDVASVQRRLKQLRRTNPTKLANKCNDLFKTHTMVIPTTLLGHNHSFDSGQSSGQSSGRRPSGSSGGAGGPIRRRQSTTTPSVFLPQVSEYDPEPEERI
ncbi:hypothetical protein L195_g028939, partial [Trifolium pratense]